MDDSTLSWSVRQRFAGKLDRCSGNMWIHEDSLKWNMHDTNELSPSWASFGCSRLLHRDSIDLRQTTKWNTIAVL